jgi:hypothetical protein
MELPFESCAILVPRCEMPEMPLAKCATGVSRCQAIEVLQRRLRVHQVRVVRLSNGFEVGSSDNVFLGIGAQVSPCLAVLSTDAVPSSTPFMLREPQAIMAPIRT